MAHPEKKQHETTEAYCKRVGIRYHKGQRGRTTEFSNPMRGGNPSPKKQKGTGVF
jgi:hypothetical protein